MVSGLVTSPNDHSLMRSGDASLRLMVSNPFKFVMVFDFIKVLNTNYKWGANNTNDANGIIRVCLFVKAFAYFIRVIRGLVSCLKDYSFIARTSFFSATFFLYLPPPRAMRPLSKIGR